MTAPGVSAFCVAVTLGAYLLSRVLARRYPSPLTTPVFCSTALIIAVLTPSGVGVADYEPAKRLMVLLLGPATVSLAVPLYKNRHTLLRNTLPALVGLGVGSLATLGAAVVIARLLGLPEVIVMDNGPEFSGRALDTWAYARGVQLRFIRPGSRSKTPSSRASTASFATNA